MIITTATSSIIMTAMITATSTAIDGKHPRGVSFSKIFLLIFCLDCYGHLNDHNDGHDDGPDYHNRNSSINCNRSNRSSSSMALRCNTSQAAGVFFLYFSFSFFYFNVYFRSPQHIKMLMAATAAAARMEKRVFLSIFAYLRT